MADVLSPEYDMKSRLEVTFSSPIFTDTGALYSDEYITNRGNEKTKILSALRISPNVNISVDDIALTPNKMSVTGEFREGVKYTIRLDNVEDIYGRTNSFQYAFTPEKKPYLSLVIDGSKTIFTKGENVNAKIYALSSPQDMYTVKLCKIGIENYSQMERVMIEGKSAYRDAVYALLSSDRATDCVKKDITLSSDSSVTTFSVNDMVNGSQLSP